MSKRFNPLSTGVAIATAGLILGIAGCAGTRTDTAGLSRESTDNSQAVVAQADTPVMPAPVATVAAAPVIEPAPAAVPMASDTAAIPPADQAPAITTTTTTTYPSSPEPSTSVSTTTTTPAAPVTTVNEEPLPPRSDRN
ncbi:hypothetical protein [Roseateles sp. P5_E7]